MTHANLSKAVAIGQRFGKLVVVGRVDGKSARALGHKRGFWALSCDCGQSTRASNSTMLVSGRMQSCGCVAHGSRLHKAVASRKATATRGAQVVDITGMRFGILTALNYAYTSTQGAHWTCKCDCGALHVARAKDLRNGNTASCGCLQSRPGGVVLDINRPWRQEQQVDDGWLVLIGERAPVGAGREL